MIRRLLLIFLVFSAAFLALPAGVSHACSCAQMSRADAIANADVVFKGTATQQADPQGGAAAVSSGRSVRFGFTVDTVVKGNLGPTAGVTTAASGASCGAEFAIGQRYLVLVQRDTIGRLETSLCSGNEQLQARPAANPEPEATDSPAPAPTGEGEGKAEADVDEPGVAAVLGAVAAVAALAALVVLRVRGHGQLPPGQP